ncbi:glycosyltransferase family 32 protein [Salinisphaera sp. Q1T1-3]|uniref:glycosyltransferase family 32 protein n=1 Tax=Salinisphaera sp. Q1T1-3 TaxID=2321229 RepID=UPI000E712BC8|nr:capsular polysaccharide synthesis protein [Salinisphaera sp. Q1T1-3]RJS92641.1 hypothetical protein D3260_10410 [Salinisphaera sp. Q1T1-3]
MMPIIQIKKTAVRIAQRYVPRHFYKRARKWQFAAQAAVAAKRWPSLLERGHEPHTPFLPSQRWVFRKGASQGRSQTIPRQIWLFWETLPAPAFIEACYRDIERKNPHFTVTLLNSRNVASFVPEFDAWPEDMLPQHKANLLRLYLVFRYGGIWLDSSIILGESLDWVIEWQEEQKLDFIGFHNDRISRSEDEPTIENWFLAAPPGNQFLRSWIDYLSEQAGSGADACYRELIKREEVRRAAERVPNPRLRVAYLACAAALYDCKNARMGLVRVRDEAFAIVEERSSNDWDIAINWLVRAAPGGRWPVLSKLTQKDRGIVEAYLERGLYQSASLIGQVVDQD